jgi:pyruvate dehydrogenase E2 component (dihydrolipoyllysine-residue acetyltransferase)
LAAELTMPKLSDSAEDVTITAWLVSPGDSFTRGDPLVEVETDKATVVYEAETDGVLGEILVAEGESVAVGSPIARLAGDGAAAEPAGEPVESRYASLAPPALETPAAPPAPGTSNGADGKAGRARATPVARRAAVELGISLHGLQGTGPGGRITQSDVRRAAESGAARSAATAPSAAQGAQDKGASEPVELTTTQATIARRMNEAWTIPMFTVSVDVDMTATVELRQALREHSQIVPSLNDFVVKSVAATLREFPAFNASYEDGKVTRHSRVNVGIAVATDDALLVPALFDADRKSLWDIAAESRELAERAKTRKLTREELTQSTFTVSNLGMFGVSSFTAIVDPPQIGILAVGGVARRAVEAESGGVEFRSVMTVTLSADHRVVYGADGARFLAHLRSLLERPLAIALDLPPNVSPNLER